jgi:transcriptional regulator with XRE-family HTH domain
MSFLPSFKFPKSAIPSSFGFEIATARKARRWTQARLASAAGLTRETIARLENGHRRPEADTVFRLRAALELEPDALIPAWPEWSPIGTPALGARSRERRRAVGLSLQQVASRIGVSGATLSRFERELSGSSVAVNLEALASALGFEDCDDFRSYCAAP